MPKTDTQKSAKRVNKNSQLTGSKLVYNGKFIKYHLLTYCTKKGNSTYELPSRKLVPDAVSLERKPDAVRILPYFYDKNGKLQVVLIREFRHHINQYIYALPAGLIDPGESPMESAQRELKEEVGAEIVKIWQSEKQSYASAGFCDESAVCFEAEVKMGGEQNLVDDEEITTLVVDLKKLSKMLDSEDFCLASRLQLRAFMYRMMLEEHLSNKKIGAFVGKFLPPHIGHLSAIDKAIKECDEVIVVLSDKPQVSKKICEDANFPYFDSKKRINWLKKHYKNNKNVKFYILDENIADMTQPEKYAELFWKTIKEKVNFKYADEHYRDLNETYFKECTFVPLDRTIIPISGTKIRTNLENLKFMMEEGKKDVLKALKKQNKK